MTDGVFRSVARMLVAFSRFPDLDSNNIGQWIRYEGFEHFTEAKRRGGECYSRRRTWVLGN